MYEILYAIWFHLWGTYYMQYDPPLMLSLLCACAYHHDRVCKEFRCFAESSCPFTHNLVQLATLSLEVHRAAGLSIIIIDTQALKYINGYSQYNCMSIIVPYKSTCTIVWIFHYYPWRARPPVSWTPSQLDTRYINSFTTLYKVLIQLCHTTINRTLGLLEGDVVCIESLSLLAYEGAVF